MRRAVLNCASETFFAPKKRLENIWRKNLETNAAESCHVKKLFVFYNKIGNIKSDDTNVFFPL